MVTDGHLYFVASDVMCKRILEKRAQRRRKMVSEGVEIQWEDYSLELCCILYLV